MKENEFKFEPIWITALSILALYFIYDFSKMVINTGFKGDISMVVIAMIPIILGVTILPMAFKMVTGVPAIELTESQLVDNVFGVSIDWANIQDISISGTRKPFLSVILKNTDQFYAGINNPVKRILLKLLFSISPGDVSINLAFVAGSNETIIATTHVYWSRYFGDN